MWLLKHTLIFMLQSICRDFTGGDVLRVALRLGAAWTTIGASSAAPAAIPSHIIGACTGVAGRVVGPSAVANDDVSYLSIRNGTLGECGPRDSD